MSLYARLAEIHQPGVIDRVKSWLRPDPGPVRAHPNHPMHGFVTKRNRSRRGGQPPTQTRVNPAHATTQTREYPRVDPKAATQPLPAVSHGEPDSSLAVRHKPGTLAHTVHLFRQAQEIRKHVNRPVHVVQHGDKRYITTRPHSASKILHTYEQLREAIEQFRAIVEGITRAGAQATHQAKRMGLKYALGFTHSGTPEGNSARAKIDYYRKRGEQRRAANPESAQKHHTAFLRHMARTHGQRYDESTMMAAVGPFMNSINGKPAVDVRSEKKRKKPIGSIPLIRRSGPAAP